MSPPCWSPARHVIEGPMHQCGESCQTEGLVLRHRECLVNVCCCNLLQYCTVSIPRVYCVHSDSDLTPTLHSHTIDFFPAIDPNSEQQFHLCFSPGLIKFCLKFEYSMFVLFALVPVCASGIWSPSVQVCFLKSLVFAHRVSGVN